MRIVLIVVVVAVTKNDHQNYDITVPWPSVGLYLTTLVHRQLGCLEAVSGIRMRARHRQEIEGGARGVGEKMNMRESRCAT